MEPTEEFNELFSKIYETTVSGGYGTGFTDHGDSDWHLMTLFSLVLQTRAKNILELGVRDGDTSLPLTLGAYVNSGTVDAIDIVDTKWNIPTLLKSHYNFNKIDAIDYLEKCVKKYDIVYVDDWHSYPHVKKELELISKLIDKTSLVILHDLMGCKSEPNYFNPIHDTEPSSEWMLGGPYRAVNELSEDWEWMTIPVNNGLTLLRRKV